MARVSPVAGSSLDSAATPLPEQAISIAMPSLRVTAIVGRNAGFALLRIATMAAFRSHFRKTPVLPLLYHRCTSAVIGAVAKPAAVQPSVAYGVGPCERNAASAQSPPWFSHGSRAP